MRITFFEHAKTTALASDMKQFKVGAVVVYRNTIISAGHSSKKTSPIQAEFNKFRNFRKTNKYAPDSLHAEISALSKIKYMDIDFSRISVYVYRICQKPGGFGMARPCPSCVAYMRQLGVCHFCYTTDYGGFAEEWI